MLKGETSYRSRGFFPRKNGALRKRGYRLGDYLIMSTVLKRPTTLVESLWQEIESHLEIEKKRIFDEILNYPPPIPVCDVQFNFLLEERSKITEELRRMHEISENNVNGIQSIREFIESCKYFDGLLGAKLLSDLEEVLDERNSF
jgi:hypothetical protein